MLNYIMTKVRKKNKLKEDKYLIYSQKNKYKIKYISVAELITENLLKCRIFW